MTYDIWTLDETWQMDRLVKRDIPDFYDADEMAQDIANDRDVAVVIIDDNGGSREVWPESQKPDRETKGQKP